MPVGTLPDSREIEQPLLHFSPMQKNTVGEILWINLPIIFSLLIKD